MQTTCSILIVEDDDSTREGLADLFVDAGYEVVVSANGSEALQKLKEQPPPCVILLDLMMPVMDGVEFRQRQLQDPTVARVPVIVVSALDAAAAASLRANGFVRKPFDLNKLVREVEQHC